MIKKHIPYSLSSCCVIRAFGVTKKGASRGELNIEVGDKGLKINED